MKTDQKVMDVPAPAIAASATSASVVRHESHAGGALAPQLTEDVSPGQLILAALDKGVSVDVIEKLVALKERIEDRNAAKEFVQALARVKAKLPTILHSKKANFKTSSGAQVNYSYTELDELAAILEGPLTEEGFTYSWDQKLDKGFNTTTCILLHVGGHSRSASFTVPTDNNSAASPQQKIGIADTYAGRRALIAVLGLTTADKDPRAKEVDPTPVTEDQATALSDLLGERNRGKSPEAQARFTEKFLKYVEADSIARIRAIDYEKAVAALQPVQRSAKPETES